MNRDSSSAGDFDLTCSSKPIVLSSSSEEDDFDLSASIFPESNEIMVRIISILK